MFPNACIAAAFSSIKCESIMKPVNYSPSSSESEPKLKSFSFFSVYGMIPVSDSKDDMIYVITVSKIGYISDLSILLISLKYPIAVSRSSSLLSF